MSERQEFYADYSALKQRLSLHTDDVPPLVLLVAAMQFDEEEGRAWKISPALTIATLQRFTAERGLPFDVDRLAYLSNRQVEEVLDVGPSFVVMHSAEGWFPVSRAEQVSRPLYRIRMEEVLNLVSHYEATPLPHRLSAAHKKRGWPCAAAGCDSTPVAGSGGLCRRHHALRRGLSIPRDPVRQRQRKKRGA